MLAIEYKIIMVYTTICMKCTTVKYGRIWRLLCSAILIYDTDIEKGS